MKSLEILIKEHALILHALECLTAARDKLEKGERPPKAFFEKAVEFFQNFADKFHHFKEEYLMFGLLSQKKDGAHDGEIGTLRYQHERCRTFIGEIQKSIKGYSAGDEIATTMLLENLSSYISLLKLHIYIEDRFFFKMVKKTLSENEDHALFVQFKNEEDRLGPDCFENSRKVVYKMGALIDYESR